MLLCHVLHQEKLSTELFYHHFVQWSIISGLTPGKEIKGRPKMAWINNIGKWMKLKQPLLFSTAKQEFLEIDYSSLWPTSIHEESRHRYTLCTCFIIILCDGLSICSMPPILINIISCKNKKASNKDMILIK